MTMPLGPTNIPSPIAPLSQRKPPPNVCKLRVDGCRHVVLTRSLKDDTITFWDDYASFDEALVKQQTLIEAYNVPEVTHLVKITCI